jgi:hypothetical protein
MPEHTTAPQAGSFQGCSPRTVLNSCRIAAFLQRGMGIPLANVYLKQAAGVTLATAHRAAPLPFHYTPENEQTC